MIENINSPSDIKNLSINDLTLLSSEIRDTIINTVSKNGGHLASNLGMVEPTIALHRVFNSPEDKIIFDVSHQCYTHKLLTGRYESFDTLRKWGGISGFTNRKESEHDILNEGHSGSSISAALGIATANKLKGNNDHVIAVVGDGSLTNGMIYEALNNCSDKKLNLIIVINDNEMSISKNVGGLHRYLTKIRTSNGYFTFKRRFEYYLSSIPIIGNGFARFLKLLKDALKRMFVRDTIFEDLGVVYVGPVDGHNIEKMGRVLMEAKNKHTCCVVHMITKKGQGYANAENEPHKYHGVGKFDASYGIDPDETGDSFSAEFGRIISDIADADDKVCAITAAMCDGTGLNVFAEKHKDRFFDVGIAEEHAVTFASGLSVAGLKPIVALYSTFSQRVYDQLQHDVAVQGIPFILTLDRAGLVPNDGITHQGIFDYSVFSSIPNVTIYSPATYKELDFTLHGEIAKNKGLVIIRYPKGGEVTEIYDCDFVQDNGLSYTANTDDADVVIITYGRMTKNAIEASSMLSDKINTGIIRLTKVFPINFDIIKNLTSKAKLVYILDESYIEGSVGEKISAGIGNGTKIHINAVEDFVEHGSVGELMEYCGFTAKQIADDIINLI